ncbi:hypothetical protein V6N11_057785 [Hibiscus sabdariffa]|uniref:RNase H type-1 domain-containing protein n=1 Tax=Hibiscus sabdariffa TaxID=183260 RepID=A0ABR1ZWC8_9ROSI
MVRPSCCTPLWHVVSKAWPILRSSIAWSIGNGAVVDFFDDVWVLALGPLRLHVLDRSQELPSLSFSDFMDGNGNWDLNLLSTIFPHSVISHIISIKGPDSNDIVDKPYWKLTIAFFHLVGVQGADHMSSVVVGSLGKALPARVAMSLLRQQFMFIMIVHWRPYLEAIQRLKAMSAATDVHALVHAIDRLQNARWATILRWISHETNKLADAMAKFNTSYDLSLFTAPLSPLQPLLASDCSSLL